MNNRQVDLLNRLIQENEPVTGKVLAQQYLVSTKTIYNDISVINQYLKAFSSEIKKNLVRGFILK
ncbi:HTH domain-containing protein [uncultured Granulicatella sp.]|uniref:HTH domain-containing protein n=1 Tax=uncultured Granulicatella sp. TaxID=316089 RepID=UPI0028D66265|nr:HTH domain-containing protein [uncultured Granulicatella sp.]